MQYEVTERAGEIFDALKDDAYKDLLKSRMCDLMCNVIDRAEENHTILEDFPLLVLLSDVSGAINELSHSNKIVSD